MHNIKKMMTQTKVTHITEEFNFKYCGTHSNSSNHIIFKWPSYMKINTIAFFLSIFLIIFLEIKNF